MINLLDSVRGEPGYFTGLKLSSDDLKLIRKLIAEHLSHQLEKISPKKVELFNSTSLDMYHSISDQLPHDQLLTRQSRILSQTAVNAIRTTSLLQQLENILGPFDISDEEGVGRESISMRMVRPDVNTDVGSLHADDWFWQLYNFPLPEGKTRIKIWIPIYCETGKSGLVLSPNSHQKEWRYEIIDRAGMKKPLLSPEQKPDLDIFQSNPGDAVIFNYHLLHGGMVTRGESTRVSIEFTMLVPESVYHH
jgi:Phytanoyl-CoA dioxygenase (PhyH)